MKFRNFANRFLLIALLVVLSLGQPAVRAVSLSVQTLDAPSEVSKTYYFDYFNYQGIADQSVYESLGIKVYNNYFATSKFQNISKTIEL